MIDRETITKLAREAGGVPAGGGTFIAGTIEWDRFAALVASAEREACARLVGDKIQETQIYSNPSHLVQVASAIRARSGA